MNNKNTNSFNVAFPIEAFADWIKERGINDGAILDHQEVKVDSVEFTSNDDGWLYIKGALESRMDS